jgi:hypothetical protein
VIRRQASWSGPGALTNVNGGVKVMFIIVVDDVVMLVTGDVMVVFSDMVILVTNVNIGVMVVFISVVDDVVMLVTGVMGGAMVVACFMVGDMLMLVMGDVRSSCCHIDEARKSMRGTKQYKLVSLPGVEMSGPDDQIMGACFPTRCRNERSKRSNNMDFLAMTRP